MRFMDSRTWNAPLPVFCWLLDTGKMQSRIFLNRVLELNQGIMTALIKSLEFMYSVNTTFRIWNRIRFILIDEN